MRLSFIKYLITFIFIFLNVGGARDAKPSPTYNNSLIHAMCVYKSLREETQSYIDMYTRKENYILASNFIRYSYKYNVDMNLMLSQGKLESHFGSKGRARYTNSVFGVGAYDNGVNLYTFENPNESIEPYAKYIYNRYLSNGRSVDDLLNKGFVCIYGYRYASNTDYEHLLRSSIYNIRKTTNIAILKSELDSILDNSNVDYKRIIKYDKIYNRCKFN